MGNCFLSLFVRVFRAPNRASGELIDTGIGDDQEQASFMVEVQHREGDRLYFTALFREIMREFKVEVTAKLFLSDPGEATGGVCLPEAWL